MFRTRLPLLYLSFSVCALAIAACGDTERGEPVDKIAVTADAPACSLESLRELPDVRLTSAIAETEPVPHCIVAGVIGTETHFELLYPKIFIKCL